MTLIHRKFDWTLNNIVTSWNFAEMVFMMSWATKKKSERKYHRRFFWGAILWRHIRIFRKKSNCPTIWPLGGQKLYILLFFREKNIFPRLWRHRRGKIAIFAITRPCHGLIDFPAYMTTRWPKMVLFIIFSRKTYFPTIMTS